MENQSNEIERLRLQIKNLEKLSSLGMLSAGIAHEIQNPLNFVINFSKLSGKLVDDLEDVLEEEKEVLSPETWEKLTSIHEEFTEILNDLHDNLQKIEEHGNRATSIIRGILLYSRGKEDEYIPTNIQQLVKEYVWLAYHSMRANYKGFNITIREFYDDSIPVMNLIPQDFSRAVLNIMNNACYAVYSKSKMSSLDYQPTIVVDLKRVGDEVRLSIEDNGTGVPENIRNEVFDAFFTTKPAGEGTGLGLSITKSIIEEKHHGKVFLETQEGEFSRFIFLIPLTNK
ncbi:sensor histidine kinase [Parabacteroides bouchesdurhonensis]|uniref:sensor histidine kinase n=1 Tax=Parabacteroides bouchesdurhonensis TaxID=1936995 RepID=UPI000E4DAB5F|nr:HAMP domain-containing sensor histidine kinase [Parabacteroides bouchesdurhonensis]RHJ93075.1 sensor histidine kinase [Bacteroides sp. AM07-16]